MALDTLSDVEHSGAIFDFSRPSNRRSFILLAVGAIVGLGIAGYGLFTAKGTTTNTVPPEYVAIVNQRPIYRSDFNLQLKGMYDVEPAQATPEQKQQILSDMINEELLVQRGLETDLAAFDQNVRAAMVSGMETDMYASIQAKQPGEAELKAYYDKHLPDYMTTSNYRLRDLVVDSVAGETPAARDRRIQEARQALQSGQPVDAVLKRFRLRDSGTLMNNGKPDLDPILEVTLESRLKPELLAAVKQLSAGAVSEPLQSAGDTHLVFVLNVHPAVQRSFDEVMEQVQGDFQRAEQQRIWDSTIKYLRSRAVILTAEG